MATTITPKLPQSVEGAGSTPTSDTLKSETKSTPAAKRPHVGAATTTEKTVVEKNQDAPDGVSDRADDSDMDSSAETPTINTAAPSILEFFDEKTPVLTGGKLGIRPLSKTEMDELQSCEKLVRAGLPTFLAVGDALLRIQEKKLYRMYFRTFAEYCDKRLGISRTYAHLQSSAAKTMQNLLTNGEQIERPTTERQLRPLTGLAPKDQVAAWKLALEKAGGHKVSGKQVEEAVKEVLDETAPPVDWLTKVRHQLTAAGYEADFMQPVNLSENEWIDFVEEETETYVKLINGLSLSNLGICLAMRESGVKSQIILNGKGLPKTKLELHKGAPARVLDPVLSVFVKTLTAFVEYEGKLYEASETRKDSTLELKPTDSEETLDLREALEVQG